MGQKMSLILNVTGHEANMLKLAWSSQDWALAPYTVGRELVESQSANIRHILCELSYHYGHHPSPDYTPYFKRLVDAGQKLSTALFTSVGAGEEAAAQAELIVSDIRERQRLTVYSDATAHIPWNFICRDIGKWEEFAPSGNFEDFSDFWSNLFSITVRFNKTDFLPDKPLERSSFKVLYILNKTHYQQARKHLNEEEQECLDRLLEIDVGNVTDWDSGRQRWRQISSNNSLLYIFGHSDGTSIVLDEDADPHDTKYRLDAAGLMQVFRKRERQRSATICFFNGCHTAAGKMDNSFLPITSTPGFYGFIGTEAEVSNIFATRYGINFMKRVCEEGMSVQEAYDSLKTDLFPQSLLYSCFAHAKYRVESSKQS
ncbi:hypothetical protein FBZ81_10452 [Azospirillum brasilense]|jgi:hypothetical protein|nr:hypothetical protein OH82_02743 [Azospirillum brasilense]TWB83140.1 hypothetical protein FBZ81_10452 [Azospirillum brasilense]